MEAPSIAVARQESLKPQHAIQGRPGGFSSWTMASIARDGCASWPERVAIVDGEVTLTYRELYGAARRLAEELSDRGIGTGDRVGIVGDRDADTVVAILGVCMAGATYVPLAASASASYLEERLADSAVRALIAASELRALASSLSAVDTFVSLRGLAKARGGCGARRAGLPRVDPRDVAYVTYGGRDGKVLGVQVEHRSVRSAFDAHNERARVRAGDRCLSANPFEADGALLDLFLPLYVGASAVFTGRFVSPTQALRLIERHRITHLFASATPLNLLTGDGRQLDRHDLSTLRFLITGSEVVGVRAIQQWLQRSPRLNLLNCYTLNELTGTCISHLSTPPHAPFERECPIGKPHRHTRVQLLSPEGEIVTAPNEPGELILAGPQLMRAYLHGGSDGQRAFVWSAGERYFRSGDVAFRDEHGDYHFIGRVNDAVELGGERVELSVIPCLLRGEPLVESAYAGLIRTGGDELELAVGVVTTRPTDYRTARELVSRAERALPQPLRPRHWAFLLSVPRSPSGKANREDLLRQLASAVSEHRVRFYRQSAETLHAFDN